MQILFFCRLENSKHHICVVMTNTLVTAKHRLTIWTMQQVKLSSKKQYFNDCHIIICVLNPFLFCVPKIFDLLIGMLIKSTLVTLNHPV